MWDQIHSGRGGALFPGKDRSELLAGRRDASHWKRDLLVSMKRFISKYEEIF